MARATSARHQRQPFRSRTHASLARVIEQTTLRPTNFDPRTLEYIVLHASTSFWTLDVESVPHHDPVTLPTKTFHSIS